MQLIVSNFTGNTATNGGAFSISTNLFVTDCIIWSNTAYGNGGVGHIEENSQLDITTNIFRDNSAGGPGEFCGSNRAMQCIEFVICKQQSSY